MKFFTTCHGYPIGKNISSVVFDDIEEAFDFAQQYMNHQSVIQDLQTIYPQSKFLSVISSDDKTASIIADGVVIIQCSVITHQKLIKL